MALLVVEQNANLALSIAERGYVLEAGADRGQRHRRRAAGRRVRAQGVPGDLMELFFQQVVNGIQSGAIYAALALALVLIFRSTSLLNFAQGEMAMFSTYVAWLLQDNGLPIVFAILGAMACPSSAGRSSSEPIIRPVGNDNPLAIVIVTIGIFIAVNALAGWIYGDERPDVPPHLQQRVAGRSRGRDRSPRRPSASSGSCWSSWCLLYLLFQKTKVGLAMRAVSSNAESSRPGRHPGRAHPHAGLGPGRRARRAGRLARRPAAQPQPEPDAQRAHLLVRRGDPRGLRQPARRRGRRPDRRASPRTWPASTSTSSTASSWPRPSCSSWSCCSCGPRACSAARW